MTASGAGPDAGSAVMVSVSFGSTIITLSVFSMLTGLWAASCSVPVTATFAVAGPVVAGAVHWAVPRAFKPAATGTSAAPSATWGPVGGVIVTADSDTSHAVPAGFVASAVYVTTWPGRAGPLDWRMSPMPLVEQPAGLTCASAVAGRAAAAARMEIRRRRTGEI